MVLGCTRAVVQLICCVPCLCVSGCNAASVIWCYDRKLSHRLRRTGIDPK